MLIKNNAHSMVVKEQPHYGLRKLSVGVASVLLGTTTLCLANANVAHADTTANNNQAISQTKTEKDLNDNNSAQNQSASNNINNESQPQATASEQPTNTLNVASATHDNQNSANNNRVLAANLAKINTNSMYQGEATNYSYSLTDTYNGGAGTPLPKENSLGFLDNHHIGVKGSFTLKTNELKKGNKVYLGSIELSNSLNDNSHNIWLTNTHANDLSPVDYLGHFIGHIVPYQNSSDHVDFYLRVDQENNFDTPTIEISNWLQNDVWAYNWQSDPKSFKGVPNNFTENLTMPDGTTYHFNMYNNIRELTNYRVHTASTVGTHSFNLYDYASPAIAKNGGNDGQTITGLDFDKLNNGGTGIVVPNTGYQMFYSFKNEKNQSAPSVLNTNYNIPVKNKNNKLTYETLLLGASMINYQNAGSNLTQQDLIAKSKPGTALYSLQNDGTYLCYINLTPEQLTMNKQTLTDFLKAHSKVVAIDGDQALQNTVNYYFNDNFKGRSLNYAIVTYTGQLTPYDQSSVSSRKVIDPANGKTIIDLGTYTGKPDDLQLKGKSGIRIHYINSMNGQEVSSIDQRIDNANSTLTYQAKNPLGQGYVLRNSTDNKLLNGTTINGTVLNGNTQSSITFPAQNTIKDIYYIVDPQTQNIVINYIDQATNKTLKTDKVSGYSDDKANYNSKSVIDGYTKQNYVVAKNDLPTVLQYDHDTSKDQTYNVYLKENHATVNDSKTINEIIHYVYDNGTQAQPDYKAMPITFTRTGQKNLVTGEITWGNWKQSANQFDEVKTPAVTGFTPDVASVNSIPVTLNNTNDIVKTVTYTANNQNAIINYIDDVTGQTIHSDNANGKFNQTINFDNNIDNQIKIVENQGYVLKSNSFNNQKYQTDNNKNVFEVHFTHGTKNVQRTQNIVENVHYQFENGQQAQPTHTQTVTFIQNGVQDLVTKNINWKTTESQQFGSIITPTMTGYAPDITNIPVATVNFGDKNIDKTVTYKANNEAAIINFIDDTTGKTIKTDNTQGKFGQQIIFSNNVPTVINHFEQQGYELVSNNFNNQNYTNSKSSFAVHLKHKIMPVQKTKDIIRTINYLAKDSGKVLATPTKQVLHFVQNGVQDMVTKNTVWNNTATDQAFNDVKTPTIADYTTDTKDVGSQTVTMNGKDSVVNVYYNTAKAVINNNQGKKPITPETSVTPKDDTPAVHNTISTTPVKSDVVKTPENKGSVSANNVPTNNGTIVAHADSINPATVVNNSNKTQLVQTNANNHSDTNVLIELGLISASVALGMAEVGKKEY